MLFKMLYARVRSRCQKWLTATHVHIHGHALIFKSIGEEQDEETSDYTSTPPSMTLEEAEKMLNDVSIAKKLGVTEP